MRSSTRLGSVLGRRPQRQRTIVMSRASTKMMKKSIMKLESQRTEGYTPIT